MSFLIFKFYLARGIRVGLFIELSILLLVTVMQAPAFLNIIRGVEINFFHLLFIIMLKTFEWIHFITLITLIASLWMIFSYDVRNNIEIFLQQIGKTKQFLIKPMQLVALLYAIVFFVLEGFALPYANFLLKEEVFELYKKKVIVSIEPMKIFHHNGWNFSVIKKDKHKFAGLLINKQLKPDFTVFIEKMSLIDNKRNAQVLFDEAFGKAIINDKVVMFEFEKAEFTPNKDWVNVKKTHKYYSILQLDNKDEICQRLILVLLSFLTPFFIFTIMFCKIEYLQYFSLFCMVVLVLQALSIIQFNFFLTLFLSFLIYFFYRKSLA